MTARAFIIAIENYNDKLPTLPGTNDSAVAFREWLLGVKKVKADSILACADETIPWRTTGTTSREIIKEIAKLVDNWADKTAELFFFFSGHGFSSRGPADKNVDILVASDFETSQDSGLTCLNLDEIKDKLTKWLGQGNHYYFVDACRNYNDQIEYSKLGLKRPDSVLEIPSVYKLYSTAQGATAKTASGFTATLVKGLSGSGVAKDWRGQKMWVVFDGLCRFLKTSIKQQTVICDKENDLAQPTSGLILELNPIPESDCEIIIEGADAADIFTLSVSTVQGPLAPIPQFQGPSFHVPLKPGSYFLSINSPGSQIVAKDPSPSGEPISIFDPCTLRFIKQPPAIADGLFSFPPPTEDATRLTLSAAPKTEIQVENMQTGVVRSGTGEFDEEVEPGNYLIKMQENGFTIATRNLSVAPGQTIKLDLLERPESEVHEGIRRAIAVDERPAVRGGRRGGRRARGAKKVERGVIFTEELGPTANWDLGLWLTLMGASRIMGLRGEFKRLSKLPLMSFDDMREGDSPVYLLAGSEKKESAFTVALSRGPEVSWEQLSSVEGLPGIYERRFQASAGAHYLSFKAPEQQTITYATYCLSNRVTFFVFTEDAEGRLSMHQFLLPIRSLFQYLDKEVLRFLEQNPLKAVQTMFLAQSQFKRKRPLAADKGGPVDEWEALIHGKWLDPIMSFIGAYELIRRGHLSEERELLKVVIKNLRRYFSGIPDTEALAKLIGEEWRWPKSPPLLLDGYSAFDDLTDERDSAEPTARKTPGLSPNRVDYSGPWTAWRGAVNDPAQESPGE